MIETEAFKKKLKPARIFQWECQAIIWTPLRKGQRILELEPLFLEKDQNDYCCRPY